MSRLFATLALLLAALTTLAVPATARPIDQAGWAERKRFVILPNGLRMAYVELGDPNGPPLLLLHGYTDTSRVWTPLAPYLARHRAMVAAYPDARAQVFPELGHNLIVERPHEVGPVLAAFLRQPQPSAAAVRIR
ncbi:MAG TPA: hypothetical protein VF704_00185 [Allosphingosinicella sp.]|jgi:pimeloyl-ACP methyl ester carboxylesterase